MLGPLHDWWGAWFRLLGTRTMVGADHVQGIVGDHAVVCGVIHPCHIWSMAHITFITLWDGTYIFISSSLDHYTTAEVHWSGWFISIIRLTSEHVWGVVGYHDVVYEAINPCHRCTIHHITLIKQRDSISIQISSFLDHYITVEVHGSSFSLKNQANSWACPRCSWRSWCGLWCDSSLLDVVYASFSTGN